MSAHMVTLLYGSDRSWLAEYGAHVPQIIKKHGGAYEVISNGEVERPEGEMEVPFAVATFRFPSRQAITDFLTDPDYAPFIELRNRHTRTEILMFDDMTLTGAHAS